MKVSYRTTAISLAGLLAIGFASWFYASPYLAVNAMREAAEQNDPIRLATYVDFPALKESLKGSINASLAQTIKSSKDSNPLEALSAVLASAVAGPMIDALVTPENLAMMMQGERPTLGISQQAREHNRKRSFVADTSFRYVGFDSFAVEIRKKDGVDAPVVMLLSRHGLLSWKLTAVQLPPDALSPRDATVQDSKASQAAEYDSAYACAMESLKADYKAGTIMYCMGNSRDPTSIEAQAHSDADRDFRNGVRKASH